MFFLYINSNRFLLFFFNNLIQLCDDKYPLQNLSHKNIALYYNNLALYHNTNKQWRMTLFHKVNQPIPRLNDQPVPPTYSWEGWGSSVK